MGFLRKFAILMSLCIVGLSICVYSPVPEGISEPWKVRFFLSVYKAVQLVARAMEIVGIDNFIVNMRTIVESMAARDATSNTDPLLKVTDTTFDGVKVRIYHPKNAKRPSPALIYFHGGGWTYGSLDTVDCFTADVSKSVGIVVVSVGYRLAPEHPFPIPFEDCVTATLHSLRNSQTYGINDKQVAVAGDSAGGNLAAAVVLFLSRNSELPQISLQVLIYPCAQPLDFKQPSYLNVENHALLYPLDMAEFWSNYIGPTSHPNLPLAMLSNQHTSSALKKSRYADLVNAKLHLPKKYLGKVEPSDIDSGNETLWKEIESKALNPYMSPLLASDLDKVAPAVVVTAEHDILRDEGIMYAERLRKSGVKVKHRNYNMLHGFAIFNKHFEISRMVTTDVINDLKEHFKIK